VVDGLSLLGFCGFACGILRGKAGQQDGETWTADNHQFDAHRHFSMRPNGGLLMEASVRAKTSTYLYGRRASLR
jgi:hypothetical protein